MAKIIRMPWREVAPIKIQGPKGTNDILPGERFGWQDSARWHAVEAAVAEICRQYNYAELRPAMFELTELFVRGIGEGTDVVAKEMFSVGHHGDYEWSLRPELTAGLCRAWIEHGFASQPQPTKLWTVGPAFRAENVQAGRYRQFHTWDVEVFGAAGPDIDAEVIYLGLDLADRLGIKGLEVHINSLGHAGCRAAYREKLKEHFRPHLHELCADCNARFERNPLRLLDCKADARHPARATAPVMLDHLCDDCRAHWDGLQAHLRARRVNYRIDPGIVRGLDYYTRTVFEVIYPPLGAQSTVWGGGRYDGLMEAIGGPATPGVGFGLGMERLILTLDKMAIALPQSGRLDLFIASLGEGARAEALRQLYALRGQGLRVDVDYLSRSFRKQMDYANKLQARYVAVIGDDELAGGTVNLKDMDAGTQTSLPLSELATQVRRQQQ